MVLSFLIKNLFPKSLWQVTHALFKMPGDGSIPGVRIIVANWVRVISKTEITRQNVLHWVGRRLNRSELVNNMW
jgi:hypothetical protein